MTLTKQVYSLCKKIPKGKVTTYKEISNALNTKAYQAIGQILRCNPDAPKVPCHRVIKSNGNVGGFKGELVGKEINNKIKLLKNEGVFVKNNKIDLQKYLFRF